MIAVSRCCLALFCLLLASDSVESIKCFKTSVGSTPHAAECGTHSRACRIIVKPYKLQNDSAVTECRDSQLVGRFVYDCAVECPIKKEDWNWNEMECCSSDMCNTGDELRKHAKCYISKGKKSTVNDYIQICQAPERCGINVNTEETRCATTEECSSAQWTCCKETDCFNKWGVEKVAKDAAAKEESTDATNLVPSTGVLAAGLLILAAQAVLLLAP